MLTTKEMRHKIKEEINRHEYLRLKAIQSSNKNIIQAEHISKNVRNINNTIITFDVIDVMKFNNDLQVANKSLPEELISKHNSSKQATFHIRFLIENAYNKNFTTNRNNLTISTLYKGLSLGV